MNELEPEKILRQIPGLEEKARLVTRGVHGWVLSGGNPRRIFVDFLHGTFLGHPLHPVLTDVTIGAWMFGYVLDVIGLRNPNKGMQKAADSLLDIGNASAAVTALAGLADFSTAPPKSMATGATHALLNTIGLSLNVFSSVMRKNKNRNAGFLLSSITTSILLASAWLGGELVYKYRVGVNKTPKAADPDQWHPALREEELSEQTPVRVEVDGSPVLLYRNQGLVYAIGAVCGHEGGPLDEGDFEGYCVTCPWHQSVYDLRDGSVVHGPTTYAEPAYDVRFRDGMIELRLKEKPAG